MPDNIPWDYQLSATPYGRLLQATVDRVKALNLAGIPQDHIVLRKVAWHAGKDDPLQPPYVIVSWRPETTDWREGTNERDAIGYAVMLTVAVADSFDYTTKGIGLQVEWRRKLRQAFHNKTARDLTDFNLDDLPNVAVLHSYMEAGEQFIEPAKRFQMDAQYWLIRFNVWEPRS